MGASKTETELTKEIESLLMPNIRKNFPPASTSTAIRNRTTNSVFKKTELNAKEWELLHQHACINQKDFEIVYTQQEVVGEDGSITLVDPATGVRFTESELLSMNYKKLLTLFKKIGGQGTPKSVPDLVEAILKLQNGEVK